VAEWGWAMAGQGRQEQLGQGLAMRGRASRAAGKGQLGEGMAARGQGVVRERPQGAGLIGGRSSRQEWGQDAGFVGSELDGREARVRQWALFETSCMGRRCSRPFGG
jgi:hypothetical protein